ncbi:glycosyltransferase family 32 protein [Aspergillus novofumigatus IBT 16806]|uniref:Putative glycosyl transferase n=1 Tax=Aspergillus novofumigatus (strain IBT 16806) TaxID=1392255 RepID=A0A2I1BXR3_ASPN1|nr:putative glycosyl transferase [Aspergillus novofumigatus IBT 16806]PKX90170.1 putative glycosyl transferase [Aspergillus novofumigatus IBT 16806]
MGPRRFRRQAIVATVLVATILWLMHSFEYENADLASNTPLLLKYIHPPSEKGGVWYIPPSWLDNATSKPESIVKAAKLASDKTQAPQRQIPLSSIPMIVHQTWKNTDLQTWPQPIRQSTEKWLRAVEADEMAYFLWDDDGINQFIKHFEPGLETQFYALASNVERTDVFRVLVSKWIGGVYGDMDTEPLRKPKDWINASDIQSWRDTETGDVYRSTKPVRAVVGLEADCPPIWAFAWAPGHPILQMFIDRFSAAMQEMPSEAVDPLVMTGPVAFSEAVQSWLRETTGLRWNALTGLHDGGGASKYGNMGSKPPTDPSARLLHRAQGSWRKFDLVVEYGKFCRTVFGRCREWTKVPHTSSF